MNFKKYGMKGAALILALSMILPSAAFASPVEKEMEATEIAAEETQNLMAVEKTTEDPSVSETRIAEGTTEEISPTEDLKPEIKEITAGSEGVEAEDLKEERILKDTETKSSEEEPISEDPETLDSEEDPETDDPEEDPENADSEEDVENEDLEEAVNSENAETTDSEATSEEPMEEAVDEIAEDLAEVIVIEAAEIVPEDEAVPEAEIVLFEEAAAQSFAYAGDAVAFIKEDGSEFGMFKPQEGTNAVLNGDTVEITYKPKNTTVYTGFYYGDINSSESWASFVPLGSDGTMTFTVSKAECGMAYPVAPVKPDGATTGSQYYLAIPAADKLPVKEPETPEEPEEEKPAAAVAFAYEGETVTFIAADGSGFGMFSPQEGTEAVLNGDTVEINYVPKNKTVYSGFYYGDINYEDSWADFVTFKEDGTFTLTVSKAECGMAYPVAPIKVKDGTTTSSQYYLAIPAADKLKEKEPEVTEAKSYAVEVTSEGGSMYAAAEGIYAYIAELEDGTFAARITTKNGKADMAGIGEREDVAEHRTDWYKNEGNEEHSVFTIPVESMDCSVVVYFRNASSGNWSSSGYTYTFNSENRNEASEIEVALGENVDPAVGPKEDEKPTPVEPTPAEPTDPPVDPVPEDKPIPEEPEPAQPIDQDAVIILKSDKTEYGMMRIERFNAVTDGKNITITFYTNHETYAQKIFLGTVDEISTISQAYARAKDTSFTITVPYTEAGKLLPMVIATEKGWKAEQYYIQIPKKAEEIKEPVKEAPQEQNTDTTPYTPADTQGSTNGTTPVINNQTGAADGVYTPDSFSFAGGTGKLTISCPQVAIRGGKAYATLVFSSGKIIYVKANGTTYYPAAQTAKTSTFEVPVVLNANNQILGCTTAMSQPHEVAYTIYVGLNAGANASAKQAGEEMKTENGDTLVKLENAPAIPGLTYQGTVKTESAKLFRLHYYEGGSKVLEISLTDDPDWEKKAPETAGEDLEEEEDSLYDHEVLSYLFVPADTELPAGVEKDYIVVNMPVEHVYLASTDLLERMDPGLLEQIAAVAEEADGNDQLQTAVAEGTVKVVGSIQDVDYKELLLNEIDLAVVAVSDIPAAEETDEDEDDEDQDVLREQIQSYGEEMSMLNIPLLLDRSEEEADEKAQEEWKAVYDILLEKADEK